MKLAVSSAARCAKGESVSGDCVVLRDTGAMQLLAVMDVLGHGVEANKVALRAEAFLQGVALERGTLAVVQDLHRELQGSRGAAIMLLLFRSPTLVGCGVGNVEMRLLGAKIQHVTTPGVLGHRLRNPHVFEGPLVEGARLLVYSDGITPHFDEAKVRSLPREAACEYLLSQSRSDDDATVVVADVEN